MPLDLLAGPGDQGAQADHRRASSRGLILPSGSLDPQRHEDQHPSSRQKPNHDDGTETLQLVKKHKRARAASGNPTRLKNGFCVGEQPQSTRITAESEEELELRRTQTQVRFSNRIKTLEV